MSSYVCSAKHFNSIESKFHKLIYDSDFRIPYSLKDVIPKFYSKQTNSVEAIEEEITDLILTLRELNAICVTLQYKAHYVGELDEQIKFEIESTKEKTSVKELTLHGLYNAMTCLRYQIEIDHLTYIRELTDKEKLAFTFLNEMINCLAHEIINSLPDDKTNTWSID